MKHRCRVIKSNVTSIEQQTMNGLSARKRQQSQVKTKRLTLGSELRRPGTAAGCTPWSPVRQKDMCVREHDIFTSAQQHLRLDDCQGQMPLHTRCMVPEGPERSGRRVHMTANATD